MNSFLRRVMRPVLTIAILAAPAVLADPAAIMQASCSACHTRDADGNWSRISGQRKSPEGWQMTLARMRMVHGARLMDPADPAAEAADIMRELVQHLAATQGLAPSEAAPYRYILEREYNDIEEHPSALFGEMCARCHSGARVGLQRRSDEEWRHLIHFHLGQYPTAEYSLMGRDRDWFGIALNEMLPFLSEHFGDDDTAWQAWQAADKPRFSGRWRLAGQMPGHGRFSGVMQVTADGADHYQLDFSGAFESGERLSGSGSANVYSGYEWRATVEIGGQRYRQIFAAGGDRMRGRMFRRDQDEYGLRLQAQRENAAPSVLALFPDQLRIGDEQTIAVIGTHLDRGELVLAPGIELLETLSSAPDRLELRLRAAKGVVPGRYPLLLGDSGKPLSVYDRVAALAVEPGYAVARVGGNGGSEAPVDALFDAWGISPGADGRLGTADDLRVGPLDASWSVEPFDAQAVADRDLQFAGSMSKGMGLFSAAAAGPNPERKYQTNNAGNLRVVAKLKDGEEALRAESHLIVTVQRWNNPPIR